MASGYVDYRGTQSGSSAGGGFPSTAPVMGSVIIETPVIDAERIGGTAVG